MNNNSVETESRQNGQDSRWGTEPPMDRVSSFPSQLMLVRTAFGESGINLFLWKFDDGSLYRSPIHRLL
jgi:hypothetical protein